MPATEKPSSRKLVGIGLIFLLILVWAVLVASLSRFVGTWPALVQAFFYIVAGIIWIFPLKPLLLWMETGSFRPTPRQRD